MLTIMIVECWALNNPAFGAISLPYYQPTNLKKPKHASQSVKPLVSPETAFENITFEFNGLWANMWRTRDATTPAHIINERSHPFTAPRRPLLGEASRIGEYISDSRGTTKTVDQNSAQIGASLLPHPSNIRSAHNDGDHQRRVHQKILKSNHDDQIEALINRISISEPRPTGTAIPGRLRTFAGRFRWIVILPHIISTFSMNPKIMMLDAMFCLALAFYFRPKSIGARHLLESLKRRNKPEILRILATLYLCYNVLFIISHLTGTSAFLMASIRLVWSILNMWDTILFATVRSMLFGSICYLVFFSQQQ